MSVTFVPIALRSPVSLCPLFPLTRQQTRTVGCLGKEVGSEGRQNVVGTLCVRACVCVLEGGGVTAACFAHSLLQVTIHPKTQTLPAWRYQIAMSVPRSDNKSSDGNFSPSKYHMIGVCLYGCEERLCEQHRSIANFKQRWF